MHEIWKLNNDMRFMQLIYNLQHSYSVKNDDLGLVKQTDDSGLSTKGFDMFNLEDDELENYLKSYLVELQTAR